MQLFLDCPKCGTLRPAKVTANVISCEAVLSDVQCTKCNYTMQIKYNITITETKQAKTLNEYVTQQLLEFENNHTENEH